MVVTANSVSRVVAIRNDASGNLAHLKVAVAKAKSFPSRDFVAAAFRRARSAMHFAVSEARQSVD